MYLRIESPETFNMGNSSNQGDWKMVISLVMENYGTPMDSKRTGVQDMEYVDRNVVRTLYIVKQTMDNLEENSGIQMVQGDTRHTHWMVGKRISQR